MRTCFKMLSVICLLSLSLNLWAGEQDNDSKDFEFVRKSNPWLEASNASGLWKLQTDRVSVAGISLDYGKGGLVPNEGSDDCFNACAFTESFLSLDRLAFYGKMSYLNFNGKNMGGPVLMDPSYNPVNFYEYDKTPDENVGNKNKELYDVVGGISYRISNNWSIGAKAGYEAGNYAKRKDPRFLNVWLDLDLTLGTMFSLSDEFSIGLNAEYRRTVEEILGSVYGTTDKQYFLFIDYGGYYGKVESFSGDKGYVASGSSRRPMFNSYLGASLQFELGKDVKWFSELSFLHRDGYYGKKASTDVQFSTHDGIELCYDGTLRFLCSDAIHSLHLKAGYKSLNNYENNYRYTTAVGSSTTVEYLGNREVLNRQDIAAQLEYNGWLGTSSLRPTWEFGACAAADYRDVVTTVHPYERTQDITTIDIYAHGRRNFTFDKNIVAARVELGFLKGFGTRNEDRELASSISNPPVSGDIYLSRDYEYRTMDRVTAGLGFRYTRLVGRHVGVYVDLHDCYSTLLGSPVYLRGKFRNVAIMTLGCNF